jgi:hypothetical protein
VSLFICLALYHGQQGIYTNSHLFSSHSPLKILERPCVGLPLPARQVVSFDQQKSPRHLKDNTIEIRANWVHCEAERGWHGLTKSGIAQGRERWDTAAAEGPKESVFCGLRIRIKNDHQCN